ncbi:hypothetical protein [Streptomyces californicus]|nr:hypothetical protein [Streptomyces californicus]MDW4912607.1 hypothetical protein [Streptomyces californicus]
MPALGDKTMTVVRSPPRESATAIGGRGGWLMRGMYIPLPE